MRKPKRVKFVHTETGGISVHASLRGHEATQCLRSAAPKTLEYAYFRKLRNGAVHDNSRSLRKEKEQLKSSKINYLIREAIKASDRPKPSIEDFRYAVSGERAGPSDHHLFLSPRVSTNDEPEQMRSKELTNKTKNGSSLLSKNITPVGKSSSSSLLDEALQNSDNQCIEKGTFSSKRHRSRQWAAHTLFSEAGKSHPKGLLYFQDSTKEDNDNSNKSHESDNPDKGLVLSHRRGWDKNLPKICSGRSSEVLLSEWDTLVSGFLFPNYAKESHAQDEPIDLGPRSKSPICRSFPAQHDISFCLPFERYRSSGSFHYKELDEFGSVIEHATEAPSRLLLKRHIEGEKDRVDSFIINQDTADNVYTRLETSWDVDPYRIVDNVLDYRGVRSSSDVDPQRMVDNVLDYQGVRSSPLPTNYYLEFDSVPSYSSTSYLTQDFGPNVDDLKYAMAEPRQFSLALPYTSEDDRNTGDVHYDSNIIFSYEDRHWLKNTVWDNKPQSDSWWKFLSAADDPLPNFHAWHFPKKSLRSFSGVEEEPIEPFAPFYKGTFNNHLFSNFRSSLDTFINPTLLLDNISHDRSEQEYFDDYDHNDSLYR